MSWLFDQLSELARADEVDVMIAADVADHIHVPKAIDLSRLLVRAAGVPSLRIQLLSNNSTTSTLPLSAETSIDLAMIDSRSAASKVRSMLNTHRMHRGAVLSVQGSRATLEAFGRLPRSPPDTGHVTGRVTRRVSATDRVGDDAVLKEVSTTGGLAVAIGGAAPSATVLVDDISGFVAILDALVTLRRQALGMQTPRTAASWA